LIRLADLVPDVALPPNLAAIAVQQLGSDSRTMAAGSLFFAVPGTKADGLAFAAEAVKNGAIAVVCEHAPAPPIEGAAIVEVPDVRIALARAAARFFPRQPQTIAAITGTSGKTSVAAFTRQIWRACGKSAASLGTLGIVAPKGSVYGSLTTPDPVALHRTLDQLAGDNVTHLALEASSHGLDQRRLDGVRLAAGAFTNLSRDHLDYHAGLDDYLAAKLGLFERLLVPGQPAVIDVDGEASSQVVAACTARGLRSLTVGVAGDFIRLLKATADDLTTRLELAHGGETFTVELPLAGAFQASNALVSAGLCIATGSPARDVFRGMEHLQGAPGRLELVARRNGAPIFVDYAHKPDALEKALRAVRPLVRGRLVVVFGCGGDRDRGKRPIMGEIAARLADRVIVTDDNPRFENAATIRKEVLAGARGAAEVCEIGDRAAAISVAIAELDPGDGLLVAGKGHETGQIIGSETLPFSDSSCVLDALRGVAA
jgi:UDP-N-acetylmuramoyl-L-alanyl-D-glutamate--2,6-diaminopimelate ligase